MSFRAKTEEARVFLKEARAMLDGELSYNDWADRFGAKVGEATEVLADAGVKGGQPETMPIGDNRDA